jgi:hypothetical protein
MAIRFHPHALERVEERGATLEEVRATVEHGEEFPAKFDRTGHRRNFPFNKEWRGKLYGTKQIEAYSVPEGADLLIITVITRFF